MQAVDPEGTAITYAIAYANATNARPNQLVADTAINPKYGTLLSPSTNQAHAGSFKARLSASDGITHATRFVNFVLIFHLNIHFLARCRWRWWWWHTSCIMQTVVVVVLEVTVLLGIVKVLGAEALRNNI